MARPRLISSGEMSMSSMKTHKRTDSSVICNGQIHSESGSVDLMDCSSPGIGGVRVNPDADVISSLRTLELIRQLSFDTSTPKIIDVSDTGKITATPSTISKYLPDLELEYAAPPAPPRTPPPERVISPPLRPITGRTDAPPLNHVIMHTLNRARSSSLSEMSGSECYEHDFDGMMMVMEPLPQQTDKPNRRRLASDQSPYAVSSASSSSDGHSVTFSDEQEMLNWHDPTGCIISLGMNHVDASGFDIAEDDALRPPPCTRLSIDSLQEWNLLCEQEGNVINKRQYVAKALSPTPLPTSRACDLTMSSHDSAEVEGVHMMVAPSLSASLSYTHTGVPSTISVSSEFHDVEDVVSSTHHDGETALSYSQSVDQSFDLSLPDDTAHAHQGKHIVKDVSSSPATKALRKKHRRHKSDGFVLLPRTQMSLKKRPGHQRVSSLDLSLQSIPESPTGVVATGQLVGATTSECDKSFGGFVADGYVVDSSCSTDLLSKHRRFNSDGHLTRRNRLPQQNSVYVTF